LLFLNKELIISGESKLLRSSIFATSVFPQRL
jgi:hypothetical protein